MVFQLKIAPYKRRFHLFFNHLRNRPVSNTEESDRKTAIKAFGRDGFPAA